ncbi:MAG: amylo-alpha-1,6-glucosidase [Desulfobacterales bacterium]
MTAFGVRRMNTDPEIAQFPEPGSKILMFRGNTITFELSLSAARKGSGWLRTNIGNSAVTRREIFRHFRYDETPLGRDWTDIPMSPVNERLFSVTVPLPEVGHFEAKCLFLPEGEIDPVWPAGANTGINVEPADTICANVIYNAFVRQFGPNKAGGYFESTPEDCIELLDSKKYAVIPPSGTFRDLIRELDFIMGTLGCRIIQLLPINPTPTTFARMGRYGSPYAALNFTTVDPAMAEFDLRATPLDQFIELVDAVHHRNGKLILDIAVNHTGWAAAIHELEPRWLARDDKGRIQNPGAWGIIWEDLTKLDYSHKDLWEYIADVFLTWCRRGVDGFRCDAGYMIPEPVWRYVIARVREQFPDAVFLLEGLGGKISVTRDLLNTGNFNWAYSELFQNYDRGQIEWYLPQAVDISKKDGILIHFAETHDNLRLAATSRPYARMRTALCALCSCFGGFGFANGVEWFATEKIVVHESPSLNWGSPENQVDPIQAVSRLLRDHPAFSDRTDISLIETGEGSGIALLRHHRPSGKKLLIIANLDAVNGTTINWLQQPGFTGPVLWDMLSRKKVRIGKSDRYNSAVLKAGEIFCLSEETEEVSRTDSHKTDLTSIPEKILLQRLKAKVLEAIHAVDGLTDLQAFGIEDAAFSLAADPVSFCSRLNTASEEPRVTIWKYPEDVKREVMIPPDHFFCINARMPFRAMLIHKTRVVGIENSLPLQDGTFFALFCPWTRPQTASASLELTLFPSGPAVKATGRLLFLHRRMASDRPRIRNFFAKKDIRKAPMMFLSTNGRGAMFRSALSWSVLQSRYDALLAANLDPDHPVNRHIMFARCRAWVVFQGYSQEVTVETLQSFYYTNGAGYWRFEIPTGKGSHIMLTIKGAMLPGENATLLSFYRHPGQRAGNGPDDAEPVRLILRPDIEDRGFHEVTKAYSGPEQAFPRAVAEHGQGFIFAPSPHHRLSIHISEGDFIREPEWHYMVHRPLEAQRGLDPDSDLFSPGYFSCLLKGDHQIELLARIEPAGVLPRQYQSVPSRIRRIELPESLQPIAMEQALHKAMDAFIVARKDLYSVIAGYPWFLDWGRDALIFVRGMIAAGKVKTAGAVIKQFGMYEENGTLPNMIVGDYLGNRDTSDAPLWFCMACSDLLRKGEHMTFLEEDCGGRKIRDILLSIANAYSSQTANGIRMDPDSALIYSPEHFTWMDTNYPAGTPRQGYPIEIQALWYAALKLFERIDGKHDSRWQTLAEQLRSSIYAYFYLDAEGYLADCLHAGPQTRIQHAKKDDALRPNQLLAITTGLVEDKAVGRNMLAACEALLIPGAIRSLADKPTVYPLTIRHNGEVLNDPHRPYRGKYEGDEDTRRKPAYHNGTAWTWMFPLFSEAWAMVYGPAAKDTALSILFSGSRLMETGCVGHIPEILDGDFPHMPRGCDAQGWGVSELLRVLIKLNIN